MIKQTNNYHLKDKQEKQTWEITLRHMGWQKKGQIETITYTCQGKPRKGYHRTGHMVQGPFEILTVKEVK